MEINESSPYQLALELGRRLKSARLNLNLTQEEVAEKAGVSRKKVLNAEKGQTQLETFLAILEALNLLDQLDNFMPEPPLSPIQLHKLKGKVRQRASGTRNAGESDSDIAEGDW